MIEDFVIAVPSGYENLIDAIIADHAAHCELITGNVSEHASVDGTPPAQRPSWVPALLTSSP